MFDFKKNSKKLKSENKTETSSLSVQLKQTRASLFGMLFSKKTPIDDTIINELEDRFLLADIGVKTTEQIIQLLKLASKKNIANFFFSFWAFEQNFNHLNNKIR